MNIKTILISGLLTLVALPAYAFHCPMDMKKIDAALASNPNLTPQQMNEVRDLRAQGEAYHKAGNHQASVDTLARAMQILQIQ